MFISNPSKINTFVKTMKTELLEKWNKEKAYKMYASIIFIIWTNWYNITLSDWYKNF